MPSKKLAQKPPTIAPDRALKALAGQLDALMSLKGRRYDEAEQDEHEWTHYTRTIIEGAFGNPSSELDSFIWAGHAGVHFAFEMSPQQHQHNFEERQKEFGSLVRAAIRALQLQLPEQAVKGVYQTGEEYAFYRDLIDLFSTATTEVFIVDAYLDEQIFNLYVDKVPSAAQVKILSNKIGANVHTVASMFAKSRPLELRSSAGVHDRLVFFDRRGWVTGQSIKDAASKKPTYLIELEEPLLTAARDIHNQIWMAAKVVI